MRLWPFVKTTLRTPLTPEEVVERLVHITSVRRFPLVPPTQPFSGQVSEAGFDAVYTPRSWFLGLPAYGRAVVTSGEIQSPLGGTVMHLQQRPHRIQLAFACLWFGMASVIGGIMVLETVGVRTGAVHGATPAADAGLMLAVLTLMVVAGWWMMFGSFQGDALLARKVLTDTLECTHPPRAER